MVFTSRADDDSSATVRVTDSLNFLLAGRAPK